MSSSRFWWGILFVEGSFNRHKNLSYCLARFSRYLVPKNRLVRKVNALLLKLKQPVFPGLKSNFSAKVAGNCHSMWLILLMVLEE